MVDVTTIPVVAALQTVQEMIDGVSSTDLRWPA